MVGIFSGRIRKKDFKKYRKLFCAETNTFLKKIHDKLGKKKKLRLIQIIPGNLHLMNTSFAEFRPWFFRDISYNRAKDGFFPRIDVSTTGFAWDLTRKQRALFLAAEIFVLYSFANKSRKSFMQVKGQGFYADAWNALRFKHTPRKKRDHAVQYVIHELGEHEHKLARLSERGIINLMSRLWVHDEEIARIIGASKDTYDRIKKNKGSVSMSELKKDVVLIDREIEEIDRLIELIFLEEKERAVLGEQASKVFSQDIERLQNYRKALVQIKNKASRWIHVDKQEHKRLKRRAGKNHLPIKSVTESLHQESKKPEIDMNRVYVLFEHVQNEKINILNNLGMLNKRLAA